MKIKNVMCHSHLMSMLLQPEKFERCVNSYNATKPLVSFEGMAGYMETTVEFDVSDLSLFAELYEESYSYPSNRSKWYHTIRNGLQTCGER